VQIDWFTLVAQIINFLILLWLLQRFLYGPIIRTMRAREELLAERFREAEEKATVADAERAALQAERAGLEERRGELLNEAEAEAAERRKAMIQAAREEAEALLARWYDAIEREKQTFLREAQTRMSEQLLQLARRTLSDLAGVELEQAIVGTFLARVARAQDELAPEPDEEAASLPAADGRDQLESGVVRTTFELPEELKEEVRQALQPLLDGVSRKGAQQEVRFEQNPSLMCGIEVEIRNRRIAWSLRDYLAGLEQELDAAISQSGPASQRNRQGQMENGVDEILAG
jgi:F-type H+-transporting ATPase subunit b